MGLRQLIWSITHRKFNSSEDYFGKRTTFGEFNEWIKFPAISSDSNDYSLPFLANIFTATTERNSWPDRETLDYQYDEGPERNEALNHFRIAYDLVKDRVPKNSRIYDIGCSTGFFLEQFHNEGYQDLHGLDPQNAAAEYAREHRPYINYRRGFFGDRENELECDLLMFFQTIFRVPYQKRLFDAIDRCARKYVLVAWVEDSCNLFIRDLHAGLAKKGLMCIEKRAVDLEFRPIGTKGADGPMIVAMPDGRRLPNFACYYLFRRITPRDNGAGV